MSRSIRESLLVERTGSSRSDSASNHPPTQAECVAELEGVVGIIEGKPGDPGPLHPARRRVADVIVELEKRLAESNATLEAIGRAEGYGR